MPPYNTCPVCGEENGDLVLHLTLAGEEHDRDSGGLISYNGP